MTEVVLITGASSGGPVTMIEMNVDDDASVRRGIEAVMKDAGRVDVVVNNAGFAVMGSIEETPMAEAKAQMETNLFGVLRVCQAVLPVN